MPEYAARTKVPVQKTRIDIEAMMTKRGADQFFTGGESDRWLLAFRLKGRHLRFVLPLDGLKTEQQRQARWRAMYLVIKAKLEAVDIGIMTLEDAFLADVVLPDRRTVAEVMRPQIEAAYSTGKMPPLLGYAGDGAHE